MRTRYAAALFGVSVLLAVGCSSSSEPPAPSTTLTSPTTNAGPIRGPQQPMATPLVGSVIAPPIPVPATDGRVHLAYEVQLTNVLSQEVALTSLAVLDRDVSLLKLAGERLADWTRVVGSPTPTTKIGPAQTAIVWLDVALEKDAAVPEQLVHAVSLSLSDPKPPLFPATMTIDIAATAVQSRKPIAISPPLSGPDWLDGDGCPPGLRPGGAPSGTSAHRMALNPIDGQLWAAERYAIDYVQLRPDGALFSGDRSKLSSYSYFGADIRAVSDGPVVAAVDGLPEQIPGASPTGLELNQYAGNHIVQDLGDGNYALYAHIKTGAVKVEVGDRLTAGQVIGAVGNTGNSDAPHLHFHVMSTPDPLRSNGLPFVFTEFRLDSKVSEPADNLNVLFEGKPAPLQPGFIARDENSVMPMELDVMTYADR
ncbi:M23 family metallopeptidase [Mycolicibacterium gadium]|uniref:Peptidase M23 n=1 Tax=Mycolicibacterium gadium TaxID=1794 RepID=A0A7I7WST2_MYCGU|nr:M23 family metallopeptidase [Mycolicibacterium gadium]BBZ20190.1 peptidase M23 [Mycolicibacterium gadium]